jgi:hypothetical protein
MRQILMKNKEPCDDFKASFVGKSNIVSHKVVDPKRIINEKRFNDYIRMRILERASIMSLPEDKKYELLLKSNYRYDQAKVKSELSRMSKSINKKAAQSIFYLFNRFMSHTVSGLYVDDPGLSKIKAELKSKDTRLVFLVLNRSINDIIVMEFLNFIEDLPIGFFFASQEDHMEIKLINFLYHFVGVFLPKREQTHDNSINYVN